MSDARRTAVALVRCQAEGDREGALALMEGTEDPLDTIHAIVGLTEALAGLLGGQTAPGYEEVTKALANSTDMGLSLSLLVAYSAELLRIVAGDEWRTVLTKVSMNAALEELRERDRSGWAARATPAPR